MCGIIGFSSLIQSNVDKLQLIIYMNSVERGTDNTGFYTLETGVKKDNDKASLFMKKNKLPSSNLFLGHVRKGSVGGKLAKNSHPFEFDNIVLAHNGTLENHWALATEADLKLADFDVDSQILAKLLDNDTKDEASELYDEKLDLHYTDFTGLRKFIGAAALMFHDKRHPNRLYVFRNYDRPLYYGMLEGSMYMSSMNEPLELIGCTDVKLFISNYLYIIENGVILKDVYYKIKEKPVTTFFPRQSGSVNQANNYTDYYHAKHNNAVNNFVKGKVLKNIKDISDINSVEFIGRYYKACTSYNSEYGTTKVKITKDKWYYVIENVVENNYDLYIYDDNDEYAIINKFMLNVSSSKLVDYAVLMCNIREKSSTETASTNKLIFTEGEIIEIIDLKKNTYLEAVSAITKRSHQISVSHVRPAEKEEIEKFKNPFQSKQDISKESLKNIDNFLLQATFSDILDETGVEDIPFKDITLGNIPLVDAETDNESTTEELPEDDEPQEPIKIESFEIFMDILSDQFDDIHEELVQITSDFKSGSNISNDLAILKEKCYEFKNYITGATTFVTDPEINC